MAVCKIAVPRTTVTIQRCNSDLVCSIFNCSDESISFKSRLVANSSSFVSSILVTALVSASAIFQPVRFLPTQRRKRVYQTVMRSLFNLFFLGAGVLLIACSSYSFNRPISLAAFSSSVFMILPP